MNMNLEFDAKDFLSKIERVSKNAMEASETAMYDITDELIRIASEITPIDKGILQKSHSKKVEVKGGDIEAKVKFSVLEGDFNYAKWIHEGIYNYGERTMRRSGTKGWSGKHYYAGRKYLERPLKGEAEAFKKHFAKTVRQRIGR